MDSGTVTGWPPLVGGARMQFDVKDEKEEDEEEEGEDEIDEEDGKSLFRQRLRSWSGPTSRVNV